MRKTKKTDKISPGDLRVLTYCYHNPDRGHSIKWLAIHTQMHQTSVISARWTCIRNGWLDSKGMITPEGVAMLPEILTTSRAWEGFTAPWSSESNYGMRGLILALHADEEAVDTFTLHDVVRWLDLTDNQASSYLTTLKRKYEKAGDRGIVSKGTKKGQWLFWNPFEVHAELTITPQAVEREEARAAHKKSLIKPWSEVKREFVEELGGIPARFRRWTEQAFSVFNINMRLADRGEYDLRYFHLPHDWSPPYYGPLVT